MIPGSLNNRHLAGGDPCEQYQIRNSVRFNSADSARMTFTPGGAGNRKLFGWAGWVKRASIGATETVVEASVDTNNRSYLRFESDDSIGLFSGNAGVTAFQKITNAKFRDLSSHYHIIFIWDMDNATAEDRVKLWVNGNRITSFGTNTNPALGYSTGHFNNTVQHKLGHSAFAGGQHFNGYLSDVQFVTGLALDATNFGFFCPATRQWRPKRYLGSYGTNGHWLRFNDGSAASAAALGADRSGNNNDWTPNGLSVTAGAGGDWVEDTTSNSYSVLNRLDPFSTINTTFTDGLLHQASALTSGDVSQSSMLMQSGKWYWENTFITSAALSLVGAQNAYNPSDYYEWNKNGTTTNLGGATLATWADGDVLGVALDVDAGTISFFKNGTQTGSTMSVGTGKAFVSRQGNDVHEMVVNFGQQPQSGGAYYASAKGWFRYAPPAGFKALCTKNLPAPLIKDPFPWFKIEGYTGTGATQDIIMSGGMSPDLVWIKERLDGAANHKIFDQVRGALIALSSNLTSAESSDAGSLTAFNTNGFELGNNANVNQNTSAYVSWNWKRGVIPGFDIVTYVGNGANRTIAHALGAVPKMVLVKNRDAAHHWLVYHQNANATPQSGNLQLSSTIAFFADATAWNSTQPDSSVFSVGTNTGANAAGQDIIAYLFAEVAGFSKFSAYTGNGSNDGPFIHLGFRPAFVMVKRIDTVGSWMISDYARNTSNPTSATIKADSTDAEGTNVMSLDIVSNGFKIRNDVGTNVNASGGTYIYAAFAEFPFKYANAR